MRIKCGNCKSEYEPRWVSTYKRYPYNQPIWTTPTYTCHGSTLTTNTDSSITYYIWQDCYPYDNGYYDYSCPVCGYGAWNYTPSPKYIPPAKYIPRKSKKPYDWRPYEFTDDKG